MQMIIFRKFFFKSFIFCITDGASLTNKQSHFACFCQNRHHVVTPNPTHLYKAMELLWPPSSAIEYGEQRWSMNGLLSLIRRGWILSNSRSALQRHHKWPKFQGNFNLKTDISPIAVKDGRDYEGKLSWIDVHVFREISGGKGIGCFHVSSWCSICLDFRRVNKKDNSTLACFWKMKRVDSFIGSDVYVVVWQTSYHSWTIYERRVMTTSVAKLCEDDLG